MPKSKKRIKKPQREMRTPRTGGSDLEDGQSVGLISSLRGGFQDLAGTRPQKSAGKKGMGIAGILIIAAIAIALIAFFSQGIF